MDRCNYARDARFRECFRDGDQEQDCDEDHQDRDEDPGEDDRQAVAEEARHCGHQGEEDQVVRRRSARTA